MSHRCDKVCLAISTLWQPLLTSRSTDSTPWDIALLCGAHSGAIQGQIKQQCNTKEETDAAMQAYKETCASAGKTVCKL